MLPVTSPTPLQLFILVIASIAFTQLGKGMGISGEWLKVTCIVVASLLGTILIFSPYLWLGLTPPLMGVIGTGGVALAKDLLSQGTRPFRG